jgi:hypothetical protein
VTDDDPEFEFFVYEDGADPRFSFWMQLDTEGMCLYDRPPEGAGMWLNPDRESDYEPVTPSEDLRKIVAAMLGEGFEAERLDDLPSHEKYFVQVLHGTVEENADALPAPVWHWMHECARNLSSSGGDDGE